MRDPKAAQGWAMLRTELSCFLVRYPEVRERFCHEEQGHRRPPPPTHGDATPFDAAWLVDCDWKNLVGYYSGKVRARPIPQYSQRRALSQAALALFHSSYTAAHPLPGWSSPSPSPLPPSPYTLRLPQRLPPRLPLPLCASLGDDELTTHGDASRQDLSR